MPTPTYTPLATVTLGASASSVTFSSIPATYRDLILVIKVVAATECRLRFNADSGSNYSFVQMFGTSTDAVSTSTTTTGFFLGADGQESIAQIMDYSATDKHKSGLVRRGIAAETFVAAAAHRWANTSAINSITLAATGGSLGIGTQVSIYGIAA
jgi:hypothetical protein